MAWYSKIISGTIKTNPGVTKSLAVIPGASLSTPAVGPISTLHAPPFLKGGYLGPPFRIQNGDLSNNFLNANRYARALRFGGSWWDLLDNYHSTNAGSIYDIPD
jgi:hypothetical protein